MRVHLTGLARRLGVSIVGCLVLAVPAGAQTDACDRYRAELAAIESGGGRDYAALAEQQAVELQRMRQYYQSLDCGGGSRFLVFGAPTSPDCAAADERLRAMEDNYQRLLAEASRAGNDRRSALVAAIEQFCSPGNAPRGLFDTLFNRPEEPQELWADEPGFFEEQPSQHQAGTAVCVRTCDGFFFPLPSALTDARDAANLCQAQCPAAPTAAFFKPEGASIESAFSADGQPYMSLPNALRYRQSFDESCSCRAPGQTWSEALAPAEGMTGGGVDVVTPERAIELSRPREGGATRPPVTTSRSIPFFGLEEGEWREITTGEGPRRVRIVAPEVIPAPDAM